MLRNTILPFAACVIATASVHADERLPPGASSCSGCHDPGAVGDHAADLMPSIMGMSAEKIELALLAYRSGERAGTVMPRIAKGFSKKELAAIAAALGRSGEIAP